MQIGFCCKMGVPHATKGFENIESCNFKTTTAKWLREHPGSASNRLDGIMRHNLAAVNDLIRRVAQRPPAARMVRIGSDIFPLFTHRDAQWCIIRSPAKSISASSPTAYPRSVSCYRLLRAVNCAPTQRFTTTPIQTPGLCNTRSGQISRRNVSRKT